MKKIIATILCFTFMFSILPAFAAPESVDASEMLSSIKHRIPDTDRFKEFHSSYQSGDNGTVYSYDWNVPADSDEPYGYMNLSVNSEGVITAYNYYDSKVETKNIVPTINRPTSDEILPEVKKQFATINPQLSSNVIISKSGHVESLTADEYSFAVQRTHNGVPVYGDTGYISYSLSAESIRYFNITYTANISFDDLSDGLSKDEVIKNYISKIGMELVYNTDYSTGEPVPYLAYIPKETNVYIDALTGDKTTPIRPMIYYGAMSPSDKESLNDSLTFVGGTSTKNELSQAEINEFEKVNNLLSKDEAEKLIRQNNLIIAKDLILIRMYLRADGEEYFYNFRFESEDSAEVYANVEMNAKTGDIISIYQNTGKYNQDAADVDPDLAREYVEKLAGKHYKSDDTGEFRLVSDDNSSFAFNRYVNEVPYRDNSIYLHVNPTDKKITSYSITYSHVQFPSTEGIIDCETAARNFLEKADYKLYYYPCCTKENMKHCDSSASLYIADMSKCSEIYANTGEGVERYNELHVGDYSDISGHYCEDIINKLSLYGIGFEESEFKPDDVITQKDFVALLVSVMSHNNPIIIEKSFDYSGYYHRADNLGIIEEGEEAPDAMVTREKAAVYMVRALGYDPVAQLDGIFVTKFTDVKTSVGYISILYALGVVDGYDGKFNPNGYLTRADAMIMIYKYLSK